MTRFRVKYNSARSQPAWTNAMANRFGPHNEGFLVEGESERSAVDIWNLQQRPGDRLNPFYLTITVEE